jgi:hypothetical protein
MLTRSLRLVSSECYFHFLLQRSKISDFEGRTLYVTAPKLGIPKWDQRVVYVTATENTLSRCPISFMCPYLGMTVKPKEKRLLFSPLGFSIRNVSRRKTIDTNPNS